MGGALRGRGLARVEPHAGGASDGGAPRRWSPMRVGLAMVGPRAGKYWSTALPGGDGAGAVRVDPVGGELPACLFAREREKTRAWRLRRRVAARAELAGAVFPTAPASGARKRRWSRRSALCAPRFRGAIDLVAPRLFGLRCFPGKLCAGVFPSSCACLLPRALAAFVSVRAALFDAAFSCGLPGFEFFRVASKPCVHIFIRAAFRGCLLERGVLSAGMRSPLGVSSLSRGRFFILRAHA